MYGQYIARSTATEPFALLSRHSTTLQLTTVQQLIDAGSNMQPLGPTVSHENDLCGPSASSVTVISTYMCSCASSYSGIN